MFIIQVNTNKQDSITVTGPVFLPYTPDCDYKNGEELLTPEKIKYLASSFKNYGIIDYEHQFTLKNKPYYLKTVGEPVKLWISNKKHTYTDVTGTVQKIPRGSLWLTCKITEPSAMKAIQEKKLTAYSATTANKEYANKLINILKSSNSFKFDINSDIHKYAEQISIKRTLIKDIIGPVLFTVTLTSFPCVAGAKFCESCLSNNNTNSFKTFNVIGDDNMDEQSFKEKFINDIESAFKSVLESFKSEEVVDEETETETETEIIPENPETETETGTGHVEQPTEIITEEPTPESNKSEEEIITETPEPELTTSDEAKPADEENQEIKNPIPDSETESNTDKEDPTIIETEPDPITENKPESTPNQSNKHNPLKHHQKNRKSKRKISNKSNQVPNGNDGIKGGNNMTNKTKINEIQYINDIVNGNLSGKSINDYEITYDGLPIIPAFKNEAILSHVFDEDARSAFKASFTEENTNKVILNTELFAQYIRKLILSDPILTDSTYHTVYGESEDIYAIGIGDNITQDGISNENYYFDNENITDADLNIATDKLRPVPQRAKLHLSDRQIRNNIYGQDLLSSALDLTRDAFNRGVSLARVYGDTKATSVSDKQFTRRDGLLKRAGQQLKSGTDFKATDKLSRIFETMFYSLPDEAQNPTDYVFYVPTNVYRAYYNEFLFKSQDTYVDIVTQRVPIYWQDIPIKVSPTLNNTYARNNLFGKKAGILLTNPKNTHFGVGRSFTIEPERMASTSSTKYWYTMDSDSLYALPEYAVVATYADAEYKELPHAFETVTTGGGSSSAGGSGDSP